jgi:flavin reductase (DIM6/NTAB) family NADH-FMN oxidoreductase RutF
VSRRKLGPIPYVYPVPIVLVGSLVDGKPNYATVGDCAIMGIRPAVVAVSLGVGHHTTRGVLEHRTFGISIPRTEDLALVDLFGQVSGRDVDKSCLVESFFGELGTAPMAAFSPVTLECRVLSELKVDHRHIFVGSVVQAHVDESFIDKDGKVAPLTELDPILYALDNRYYRVGDAIGVGYQEAKALRRFRP